VQYFSRHDAKKLLDLASEMETLTNELFQMKEVPFNGMMKLII
jgi:hypothetical protein